MLREIYGGYTLTTRCRQLPDCRWSVGITVAREVCGVFKMDSFEDPDASFILEVEAEQESLHLGRTMIQKRMVRF